MATREKEKKKLPCVICNGKGYLTASDLSSWSCVDVGSGNNNCTNCDGRGYFVAKK